MDRRIVVAVVLAVFLAASAYAQTKDFFELAKSGTPLDVEAAIIKGAKVNAQDPTGMTPLMYAAQANPNPAVVTALTAAGGDVKAQAKNGMTPLMYAAQANANPAVITALTAAGGDAKVKANNGKTAFDFVQNNKKLKGTDVYQMLLQASQ